MTAVTWDQAPAHWSKDGPSVLAKDFSFELPISVLANKIFVDVPLNGKSRRFVFDIGSPSMLSAELADELGVNFIDRQKGRDGHGALIETKVAQIDLTLGNTTFRRVPVFVAEFRKRPAACSTAFSDQSFCRYALGKSTIRSDKFGARQIDQLWITSALQEPLRYTILVTRTFHSLMLNSNQKRAAK